MKIKFKDAEELDRIAKAKYGFLYELFHRSRSQLFWQKISGTVVEVESYNEKTNMYKLTEPFVDDSGEVFENVDGDLVDEVE